MKNYLGTINEINITLSFPMKKKIIINIKIKKIIDRYKVINNLKIRKVDTRKKYITHIGTGF